jgi:hypothetical protein
MGWLSETFTWWTNSLSVLGAFFKASTQWLMSKFYLLILPFFAVLKLVFDLCRATIDTVVAALHGMGAGFHSAGLSLPAAISFVNFFFPVDEILISASGLLTFFVGCQIIATIRGIKQTILF